jgi:hypothetical protein
MKSILHLNKLIAVSFIIFFILLTSCHRYGKSGTRAPEIIQIVDGDITTGTLQIEDVNGKSANIFEVHRGASIRWLLGHNQLVTKITNIYKKPTSLSDNVFSAPPDSIGGSLNWRATINKDAGGKTEDYNIDWIDKNGQSHTFDPKIKVML